MTPPRKPQRRVFSMPAMFTPEAPAEGTKAEVDVYRILRDHVAFTAAARAETRQLRQELLQLKKEVTMKISELSSSVDRLISVATSLKDAAPATPPEQPDDPAIEELNTKIQRAIEVLEGRGDSSGLSSIGDPGAHNPQPSAEALATDINSPAARDPNAV